MVGVRFRDWKDAYETFVSKNVEMYESMFHGVRAYVYLVSKGRAVTDRFIHVTDTNQPLRNDLVTRLNQEGRRVKLAMKQENQTIREVVDELRGQPYDT